VDRWSPLITSTYEINIEEAEKCFQKPVRQAPHDLVGIIRYADAGETFFRRGWMSNLDDSHML
jgi:hypothetical protein